VLITYKSTKILHKSTNLTILASNPQRFSSGTSEEYQGGIG